MADSSNQRVLFGTIVVLAGLLAVVGVFAASLWKFRDANTIVAVVGAVTGVIGTIVTAFFGIQSTAGAGSDAAQKVSDAGTQALNRLTDNQKDVTNKVMAAAAVADPNRTGELSDLVNRFSQAGGPSTPGAEGQSPSSQG